MNQWVDFYKKRINSTYQDYFENKYKILLNWCLQYKTIREEGIGIGSISKFLIKNNINVSGFDLCEEMLNLCKLNNPTINCWKDNIFNYKEQKVDLVVTHGVLEHFTDSQIQSILNKYQELHQPNIHYIPLNGYNTPSFGDERLLPYEYWIDTFKPTEFKVIDNKDLYLKFLI